jgi:hypothetical protein
MLSPHARAAKASRRQCRFAPAWLPRSRRRKQPAHVIARLVCCADLAQPLSSHPRCTPRTRHCILQGNNNGLPREALSRRHSRSVAIADNNEKQRPAQHGNTDARGARNTSPLPTSNSTTSSSPGARFPVRSHRRATSASWVIAPGTIHDQQRFLIINTIRSQYRSHNVAAMIAPGKSRARLRIRLGPKFPKSIGPAPNDHRCICII